MEHNLVILGYVNGLIIDSSVLNGGIVFRLTYET